VTKNPLIQVQVLILLESVSEETPSKDGFGKMELSSLKEMDKNMVSIKIILLLLDLELLMETPY